MPSQLVNWACELPHNVSIRPAAGSDIVVLAGTYNSLFIHIDVRL